LPLLLYPFHSIRLAQVNESDVFQEVYREFGVAVRFEGDIFEFAKLDGLYVDPSLFEVAEELLPDHSCVRIIILGGASVDVRELRLVGAALAVLC
jgi:hypothetical protein